MYLLNILFVLIVSNWSWEIRSFNPGLLFLTWSSSILLFSSLMKESRKLFYAFLLLLIPLLIIQWKTTNNADLRYMNVTEKYIFTYRKSELPIFTINFLNKTKSINSALYIANERVALFDKWEQNLLRSIDLNLYFFGGHPRERPGIREFEKYSFLFLPFFVVGLYCSISLKKWSLLVSCLVPLIVISVAGQDNQIGPFSLFPFFTATISLGLLLVKERLFRILKSR